MSTYYWLVCDKCLESCDFSTLSGWYGNGKWEARLFLMSHRECLGSGFVKTVSEHDPMFDDYDDSGTNAFNRKYKRSFFRMDEAYGGFARDEILRHESGLPGHFICSDECRFHRNTLLECGEVRVVVSTVGLWFSGGKVIKIDDSFFETKVFHAVGRIGSWISDVDREIEFDSPRHVFDVERSDLADSQHESVVAEIVCKIQSGEI